MSIEINIDTDVLFLKRANLRIGVAHYHFQKAVDNVMREYYSNLDIDKRQNFRLSIFGNANEINQIKTKIQQNVNGVVRYITSKTADDGTTINYEINDKKEIDKKIFYRMKQKKVQLKKNDNTICESEKFTTKNTKMKYPIKKNIRTSKISLKEDIKGKHNLNILYKTKNMNKGVKGKKKKSVRVKKIIYLQEKI